MTYETITLEVGTIIQQMIQTGVSHASINDVLVQNGVTTQQVSFLVRGLKRQKQTMPNSLRTYLSDLKGSDNFLRLSAKNIMLSNKHLTSTQKVWHCLK